jgi:DNA-binding NarL/FixJ family response regulator
MDGEGNPGLTHVAIVDDHPLIRRGMECVLTEAGLDVTFSGPDDIDLEEEASRPDVVVMDLYPGGGLPDTEAIARVAQRTHVLVISATGTGADVFSAICAGACGYVTMQATDEEFVEATLAVATGELHLSPQLADVLQTEANRRAGTSVEQCLSRREEEALQLIAQGFTHSQAASRMGVGISTLDTYIKRVRGKLGAGNKAELTRLALGRNSGNAPKPL